MNRLRIPSPKLILAVYWIALFTSTHMPLDLLSSRTSARNADKVAHFLTFSGLAFLLAWALRADHGKRRRYLWCFSIVVVYAIADELSQSLLSFRTADPRDVLADACGAALGLFAYAVIRASLNWITNAKH